MAQTATVEVQPTPFTLTFVSPTPSSSPSLLLPVPVPKHNLIVPSNIKRKSNNNDTKLEELALKYKKKEATLQFQKPKANLMPAIQEEALDSMG